MVWQAHGRGHDGFRQVRGSAGADARAGAAPQRGHDAQPRAAGSDRFAYPRVVGPPAAGADAAAGAGRRSQGHRPNHDGAHRRAGGDRLRDAGAAPDRPARRARDVHAARARDDGGHGARPAGVRHHPVRWHAGGTVRRPRRRAGRRRGEAAGVRDAHGGRDGGGRPVTGTTAGRFWVVARKAAAYEWNIYRSLFRWVTRRPAASGPGARAFGYAAVITPVLVAFIVVSAIELPVLHLVLPWRGVRLLADIAGIWGLVWMLGLMASVRGYPHVVSDAGLRIRSGGTISIDVPW